MMIPEGPDRSLAELAELHRAGALTDEECRHARASLLHQEGPSSRRSPTQEIPPPPRYLPKPEDAYAGTRDVPTSGEQPIPSRYNTWIVAGIAAAALAIAAVKRPDAALADDRRGER